jgi:rod shape-determining protein MreD
MGAGMGLFEDALTHHAIGVNGIAKTVVGFLAASIGVRIDVENHTIRLVLNFLLSLLSSALVVFVSRISARPRSGMALVHGIVHGGRQLAHCPGAVSPARPSANQGLGIRDQG